MGATSGMPSCPRMRKRMRYVDLRYVILKCTDIKIDHILCNPAGLISIVHKTHIGKVRAEVRAQEVLIHAGGREFVRA